MKYLKIFTRIFKYKPYKIISIMSRKIALVTGSEGFIGNHLVKYLLNLNYFVISTHYKKIKKIKSKYLRYVKCDVKKKSQVSLVLKKFKPNEIYHLAAKSLPSFSFKNPIETIRTNVIGTLNILEENRLLNLNSKILIACSSSQYGERSFKNLPLKEEDLLEPEHLYGLSKVFQNLIALQYFKMFGSKIFRAIIFNTSGPGKNGDVFSDFCRQLINNKVKNASIKIETGDLNKYRDFLHVNDLVVGLHKIIQKGVAGESYNLCSSKYHKVKEIVNLMKKNKNLNIMVKKNKKLIRKFDEKYIFGCNKKIKKIGWIPKLKLKDIFDDVCQYYEKKKDFSFNSIKK